MNNMFLKRIDRKNTRSAKWDLTEKLFNNKDVLPMWVADMDFEAPKEVMEAIMKRASHNVYGYSITDDQSNESIRSWIKRRHNFEIKPEWISYSPGVVTSLHMIVQAFTEETDKILIQTPVYPPFYGAIEKHGRTVVKNSLKLVNDHYEIDFDDFEQKISDEKVTMFILCSPHNPVGRVWTQNELNKLVMLCKQHNVIIVSDEIHCDLIFNKYKHIPIAQVNEEYMDHVITCMAPSKTFNLAGLQASYIITPNQSYKRKIDHQFLSQGLFGLNTFGIVAMEAAYSHGEQWLDTLMAIVEENRDLVVKKLFKHSDQIKVIDSEGTYLLWLDCREMKLSNEALKEFFQVKAKVGLNDGASFGQEGAGFMRMNIACPKEILEEGLSRILNALQSL